jgi:hypothetical protein
VFCLFGSLIWRAMSRRCWCLSNFLGIGSTQEDDQTYDEKEIRNPCESIIAMCIQSIKIKHSYDGIGENFRKRGDPNRNRNGRG